MEKVQFLGGNKKVVIKYIVLFLLLIISQSCYQKKEKLAVSKNMEVAEIYKKNDSIIICLREFYIFYISENIKEKVNSNYLDKLKNKYVSKKLLLNIEEQLKNGNLDWNPFVNAQDFNESWLKTIYIVRDSKRLNVFKVHLDKNEDNCITISVMEENGRIKIKDIDNIPKSNTSNNLPVAGTNLIGAWKVSCDKNKTEIITSNDSFGYLDIHINNDYARVSVNNDNEGNFRYSTLTGITRYNKFVDWLNISHDSTVFKVEMLNSKTAKLEWFGFYNDKTQKREMLKNPFNENLNSVILLKCDE